jgi:hypothetical protein
MDTILALRCLPVSEKMEDMEKMNVEAYVIHTHTSEQQERW